MGDRDYDIKSSHEAVSNLRFRYDKKNKLYTVELTLPKLSEAGAAQKDLVKALSNEYAYKEEKSSWILSFESPVEWEDFVLSSRTLNWSLVTEMSTKVCRLCEDSCSLYARMEALAGK